MLHKRAGMAYRCSEAADTRLLMGRTSEAESSDMINMVKGPSCWELPCQGGGTCVLYALLSEVGEEVLHMFSHT